MLTSVPAGRAPRWSAVLRLGVALAAVMALVLPTVAQVLVAGAVRQDAGRVVAILPLWPVGAATASAALLAAVSGARLARLRGTPAVRWAPVGARVLGVVAGVYLAGVGLDHLAFYGPGSRGAQLDWQHWRGQARGQGLGIDCDAEVLVVRLVAPGEAQWRCSTGP